MEKDDNHIQKGQFRSNRIALVVALVAVLAVAGLAAYKFLGTPTVATDKAVATQTPAAAPKGGYVVIEEWGVKVPASGILAKLTYQLMAESGNVSFSSADLYPKHSTCGAAQEGLGILARAIHGKKPPGNGWIAAGTVGGNDFYFNTGTPPCAAETADEQLNRDEVSTLSGEMAGMMLAASK